jgi:hypothetical protein
MRRQDAGPKSPSISPSHAAGSDYQVPSADQIHGHTPDPLGPSAQVELAGRFGLKSLNSA